MTKPVFTCDICNFKGSNSYIFKRHLHRCYSLHGIASKRSSPRNPVRLKGTENLQIKPINSNTQEDGNDIDGEAQIKDGSPGSLVQDTTVSGAGAKSGDGAESVCSSVSQWGVSDSPLTVSTETAPCGNPEDLETGNHLSKSVEGGMDGTKLATPYARHYSCNYDDCTFESKSAREHLYHLRDVHGNPSKIHECTICDYASRYHNKVERHMVVHKHVINMQDKKGRAKAGMSEESVTGNISRDDTEVEESVRAGTRLRVKPLKLRRLNVKMPFSVSGGPNDSRSPPTLSPENGDKPNDGSGLRTGIVYKKVQQDDGSHVYQCQDCLYYARLISKVKKHHGLCHSKMLRCPHCDMATTGQGILYEHLMTHSGHGYVQCPDCSYVTNAKSNYEKHRTFHEAVFPYSCSVCNFGSDSESKIKRHVTTQHTPSNGCLGTVPFQDETMDTSQESTMETETSLMQDDDRVDKIASNQSKEDGSHGAPSKIEYKCPKCVMVCFRRGNFTRHLTARHGYSQLSASQLSKSMENRLFKGFKRRIVNGSSKTGGHKTVTESLKCPHCSYLAKWPSDLRRHMQVHTILKRFKCSICPNKYKYLGDLNVHIRRDHNVKPPERVSSELTPSTGVIKKASPAIFRCPICPFSCRSKAELEQHSRGHSNITKTYQCRMCDYQTYWRGDVGRHLFRHHEVVLSKEATEIEEYFILRPDIRPLTKQGPANSMSTSQAVFPGNPDPPMILDMSKESEEDNEELQQHQSNFDTFGSMVEDYGEKASTAASDNGLPKQSPQSSSSMGPVTLKEGSFVCEYPGCDFKSTISDRMEVHLALHMNIKIFMCPTCGKRTNWKWDIVKHMNKVHLNPDAVVEDVITLSMEEAKASIGEYMATFEKRARELSINLCSLCDFKSLEKNRVVRHMGTVHKNQNGKVISQVIENPKDYGITAFSNRALETAGLKSPVAAISSAAVENPASIAKFQEPPPEELAKYEKPYACAICKKPGVTKGDVKKHYNYTHPYKDVRVIYVGDGTEFNYYSGEIYSKNSKSFQGEEASDSNDSNSSSSFSSSFLSKPVRPDSKYSNPKMHGYVKPFKCSICGIRSNWKWDLKKHLRSKHPGEGGFVIMLSIEEASQTYGTECSPSHPAVPVSRPSPIFGRTSPFAATSPSPSPNSNQLFKSPFKIKEEKLEDTYDSGSDCKDSPFSQQSPQYSPTPDSSPNGKGDRSTFPDPSRRQWKCSGCDYISNWRRNMARHIHRKHRGSEGSIKVVALHRLSASQLASLTSSGQQSISPFLSKRRSSSSLDSVSKVNSPRSEVSEKSSTSSSSQNNTSGLRLWRCSKCSFKSVLRTHIIGHMQQHGIKPFKCGVCHLPFMNRGPLHKHLQKVHKCGDYIRQCKVVITYGDEDTNASTCQGGQEVLESRTDNNINKKPSTPTHGRSEYINSYFCRLCNIESTDRQEIISHLETFHGTQENDNNILKIQKRVGSAIPQDSPTSPATKGDTNAEPSIRGSSGRKLHFCHVCPYRTQKKQMLAFHMTYHRPTVSNRYKCKYCPYYVSTVRLLHQHQRKWHESAGALWSPPEPRTPQPSPVKASNTSSPGSGSGRRHACEKCPYTTNSKNDFIYHKQFHRPKRSAEFKCEYCDYWVVHKRLLKQHVRLHTKEPEPETASVLSSPAKSLYSDPGLVYDPAELTELAAIKQKMISAKVTASLSKSPVVSPMKLASSLTTDTEKPSYVLKNGLYRKLHKCKKCPYTNVRARNMQLHEMMHGPRASPHPLMKCPYCDYYVGSKGLLSHHMKVHQKTYGDTPENDAEMAENGEESDHEILPEQKMDTLLQISRFKRFGCDRCPYASAKRQHFERHLELHGSRQRYTCQYCDYSVPSNNLLLQHTKLHMMPNQNLLASQSVTNLHHLSEVPADVALASALPPADTETTVTISVIHDHLGLYENSIYDSEPKKLYRCDRCPYANLRRDYLLVHLKFHMVASAFACPYCDYSAPKQALLTQHVRVHFCPLPELSDWLLENGQTERETSQRKMDLGEAFKVARDYQTQGRSKAKTASERSSVKTEKSVGKENVQNDGSPVNYICQYCDREFPASEALIKHELQHLIGNHFERTEYVDRNKDEIEKAESKGTKDKVQGKQKEESTEKQEESTEKQAESKEKQEESTEKQEESKEKQEESTEKQEESKEKQEESAVKQEESKPDDVQKEFSPNAMTNGEKSQHLSSDLDGGMQSCKPLEESDNIDAEKLTTNDTAENCASVESKNKQLEEEENGDSAKKREENKAQDAKADKGNEDDPPDLCNHSDKMEIEEGEKIVLDIDDDAEGNKPAEDSIGVEETAEKDESSKTGEILENTTACSTEGGEKMQTDDDGDDEYISEDKKITEDGENSCTSDTGCVQDKPDNKAEPMEGVSDERDLLALDDGDSSGIKDDEDITEQDLKLLEEEIND